MTMERKLLLILAKKKELGFGRNEQYELF